MIKNLTWYSHGGYIPSMTWDVEYTDEFETWWVGLDQNEYPDIEY